MREAGQLRQAFNWLPSERTNFERIIVAEGWLRDWFERTLTNRETWITYISDVLVRHTLTRVDKILDVTGVLVQARYPS